MGLTKRSTGFSAAKGDGFLSGERKNGEKTVALIGNPNVGKSTVFNALTGMDQHTGNWPGKTVTGAVGRMRYEDTELLIADLPGTYSLLADSAEEEVARNCVLFEHPDVCVVVCDATSPERGLPLVLQTLEITSNVILCFNLADEAKRKGVEIDTELISARMGIPVVTAAARNKKSLVGLCNLLVQDIGFREPCRVSYPSSLCEAVDAVSEALRQELADAEHDCEVPVDFLAHRLLEGDGIMIKELYSRLGATLIDAPRVREALDKVQNELSTKDGFEDGESVKDATVGAIMKKADEICLGAVTRKDSYGGYSKKDRRIDKILTGKLWGYPIMLCLLLTVLWLTVVGANYPSELLSLGFDHVGKWISAGLFRLNAPEWLHGLIVDGVWRVLSFVVAVMLPPMAIFFPLFTLLEDIGYLPRIAYNLDRPFCRCGSCGKQALTMCMGLGCNAAGVVGCRIIDSPRERLLATLTNSFVPCNGRFPTLIALITIFFVTAGGGLVSSFLPALILTLVILLGFVMTFVATKLLSATIFKGVPSSFALEMPPFRAPQLGKIVVRSIFDRTLFVLGRAAAVAAPAGALIWIMANVSIGDISLLKYCSELLDPIGRFMGLDGVILLAFVLGFPANEIVLPIIVMAYMSQGTICDMGYAALAELLTANGWSAVTALCFMVFSLFHWPCSTTVITVKKETGSVKMALLSALVPTLFGFVLCVLINFVA